ncbi:b-glycosyltransferase, glycosyltransferase family 2 protein [hydrothermal vent metagenome]|uniref:B-glycosyltransferase, glycosyltransferase family 2 protein n=1 Tax=hydrothermal vent metagenome TaxID=652676 RepID=A0A3B0XSU7_9ZZZZ
MSDSTYISIVIPVYGCSECLEILYQRLCGALSQITEHYEIIMVNDASPDDSWSNIRELAKKDPRVKGINLSRNFGQHYAITAGLDHVNGEWVVVMDCDLQDKPEMIPRLYNKTKEGFNVVVGIRTKRNDSLLKKITSRLFFKIFYYFTDVHIENSIGNFGIYSKKVINNIKKFKEQNRSFGLFIIWLGFSRAEIEIEHGFREHGKSSYSLKKLTDLAIDSIVSHSNKPLKLSVKLGFILSFASIIYSSWLIMSKLLWNTPIQGWTSLMVSLFFLAGLIIISIGMLGLYIGKIFNETKQRPLYVIESITFEESNEE